MVDISAAASDFSASAKSALTIDSSTDDANALNIGIIGCGRIGQCHARSICTRIPNAKLVCVSDVFESAALKLAKTYQVPMACTDPLDLINSPAVHAIIVCSPTDTHADIIKAAAAAGKHIFCEKPVDKNLHIIADLNNTLAQHPVKFFLGFQRRFDSHFRRAKAAVQSGAIGKPIKLHLTSRDPAPPPVGYLKQSGGLFLDMSSHDFDMARFLTGSNVASISAVGMADNPEIAAIDDLDHTLVTATFENGCIVTIDNSRASSLGYDQRAEFFGTAGSVNVGNVHPNTCHFTDKDGYHSENPLNFFMERYAEAYVEEMKAFVDVVLNDTPVPCGIEDGRLTVLYAAMANLSIKEKRAVHIGEFEKSTDGELSARY
ncbi:putative oxidoreductase YrbE [Gracilariopsis chorda]|uniref:Putative oxidoreductase YrbE n=1 Tax=Gracilariopsis chorda TaxID=448386 RepID=A0A2V3IFR9_9FLOR|nr:putative oxidoreductase YrbE [Gracilariopsis chorda]|eukprot:PXF40939.1 putative oxidoreductase YrbE [Gracilariopsis chorda]